MGPEREIAPLVFEDGKYCAAFFYVPKLYISVY